jgi:hypothetical protein
MIGDDTHCIYCKTPMRSCVLPAVCWRCSQPEEVACREAGWNQERREGLRAGSFLGEGSIPKGVEQKLADRYLGEAIPTSPQESNGPSPGGGEDSARVVCLLYRNHRGEEGVRRVLPHSIWFGKTAWHPEPQWLLHAYDLGKGAARDFALKDVIRWGVNGGEGTGGSVNGPA